MCLLKECVKFIVFAFNLVFLIVGAALITVGAIYLANLDDVTKAIPEQYSTLELVPILTVAAGSIIFLISFFGCCGAIRNSPCMLTTYAVILLIIFILQIALGVFAFLSVKDDKDLKTKVDESVAELFTKYGHDNTTNEVVDFIQKEMHCCGTYGRTFWATTTTLIPPASCYEDKDKLTSLYTSGCQGKFFEFLKDAARIIGIVVLSLAATEVVGATFALCLANSVRNEIRRGGYY